MPNRCNINNNNKKISIYTKCNILGDKRKASVASQGAKRLVACCRWATGSTCRFIRRPWPKLLAAQQSKAQPVLSWPSDKLLIDKLSTQIVTKNLSKMWLRMATGGQCGGFVGFPWKTML